MGGRHSRNKGAGFEREIVNYHKERGVDAERVPLSGAAKGSYAGDIKIASMLGECKIRKSGFKQLYDWLEHDDADFLVVRADRRKPLYVLTQKTWDALMKQANIMEE